MFGLLLSGISSIGVALCFSVGKAIYDVVTGQRSPGRAVLNVGLTSVFHGVADIALNTIIPNIDLAFGTDRNIKVPLRDIAEFTAKNVLDIGVPIWLDSYKLKTLPSGLTLAQTALVDVSGAKPVYQGIIIPKPEMFIDIPTTRILKPREIVLTTDDLRSRTMPHRRLEGRTL